MRCISLLIFYLFSCFISQAQKPFTKEFWLNESNMPVKVNDLLYASTDYMWLATDNGLYRFNGRKFIYIRDSIHQPATAVAEVNGVIYAGYKNGKVGLVKNHVVIPVNIRHRAPSSAITSLRSKGGLLYITTEDEGLFVILNHVGLQFNTANGLTDNFIYEALIAKDEVMIATDRGINRIHHDGKKNIIEVFTTKQGLPDNIVRVIRPIPHTQLSWVGTQESGMALYNDSNETIHSLKMRHPWAWGQVNDVLPLNETEAWIATEEGYFLHAILSKDSLDIQPYTYEGIKLIKLIKDKAGNIWCATNKGLMMSTALYAASLELPPPYDLRNVTAITFDKNNNLWFTQNDALYKLLPGDKKPQLAVKTDASITCLYADTACNLWIGTFGKGLFYYNGNRLMPAKNIAALAGGHILSIASTGDRLWIASLNGVEETLIEPAFSGYLKVLKHHNKLSGTGSDYVYQLYPDSKERMWMATDGGGVCMYDGQQYHRWDQTSGLKTQVVYSITEDAAGNIWAGTLENGLFCYKGGRWQQLDQDDGLEDMNVYALKGTATGEVVVVTEDGIDEYYPQSRQFRHFNKKLGVDIDSTLEIPNCIAKDRDGQVYVPFEHGFIIFKNQKEVSKIPPAIHINAVSLFNKPLQSSRHRFSHDENHISFRYDGINFNVPENLHYRYKLDNYDTNWVYTNDEVVAFVQLPPGDYTFHVQASLNHSFANATEDDYSFIIIKPYWQRTWFILLVILFLFGLGYGYIRLREQGLKNMSRLQKERMVFEYEHLKSQVNPHFLFNSLNTLVSLIEDDQDAAVVYTVHLSDLYRNMLSYKDQDLIWLAEEYEIIKNYMYIQKSRFGEALQLHAEIPEHLMTTKKIVPLALQLLVENAIKHNIVSLSRPLTISIVADEHTITIKNPVQLKMSKEKGAGLGLINIKKRYALLTSRSLKFGHEGNEYIVKLPLL